MQTQSSVAELEEKIARAIEALGCRLWGCEWVLSHKQQLLSVSIEGAGVSATAEDCVKAHRALQMLLKVEMLGMPHLKLEVSSPGLDRRLFNMSQYVRYVKHTLHVRLRESHAGRKQFVGVLETAKDDHITLLVEAQSYTFPLAQIAKAHVVID